MKVFRLGGEDPRLPQWWIRAPSRKAALAYFCNSVLGSVAWNELVAMFLISHPNKTYSEFLRDFVTEEPDREFCITLLRRVPPGQLGDMLLYSHGAIELFRIGAYKGGCWIVAADLGEAVTCYWDCAGDIKEDYQTVTIRFSSHEDIEDDQWLPEVIKGVFRQAVRLIRPDGEVVLQTGEELIRKSISEQKTFPQLIGFDPYGSETQPW